MVSRSNVGRLISGRLLIRLLTQSRGFHMNE
jgi:hypothetical protein